MVSYKFLHHPLLPMSVRRSVRRCVGALSVLAGLSAATVSAQEPPEVAPVPDSLRDKVSTSTEGLTEEFGVTGRMVDLQGRFQHVTVQRHNQHGGDHTDCLEPGAETQATIEQWRQPEQVQAGSSTP